MAAGKRRRLIGLHNFRTAIADAAESARVRSEARAAYLTWQTNAWRT